MRFVIVTGMSGAGKATALKTLEDAGFFCVDNLPIQLIKDLPRSLMMSRSRWMMLLSVLISEVEGLCHSSIRAWRISEERA